ncbi:MAG TPA: tocopherol cyclase family protein [Bacillota bacterium]|nr:tocopherol cyclase family protein [Bacillota bacterium]HOG52371.1 tocopherol cyclase family protein [Bacillota bacterium]
MLRRSIWHPEAFQGRGRRWRYFEGWYYKLIDSERGTAVAVIPGIALGEKPDDAHAFIQFINATTGEVRYFRFGPGEFQASEKDLDVRIGSNHFTRNLMHLEIDDGEDALSADLRFKDIVRFPELRPFPGIMGPFSLVPWMECYHGVVNITHSIDGSMDFSGHSMDFTGGEGYIEKDWGTSFPDAWIWMQANHFERQGSSFMFSLARIPWLGRQFPGLISLLLVDGKVHLFATYNLARVRSIELDATSMRALVTKPGYTLEVEASYEEAGVLLAPKNGMMTRQMKESITAEAKVRLADSSKRVIFEGSSMCAGLEISGDIIKDIFRGRM